MKKFTLILMVLLVGFTYAQEDDATVSDVRPYRIGLKFGTPNLASLEFEYVTPLMNNRIAPFANYTGASYSEDKTKASLHTFEIGTNIYFSKNTEARGLYGSLSYQSFGAKLEVEDYEANVGTYEGVSTSKVKYNGFNVKVGARLGRKFFFRTELGYSFGSLPKEITIDGTYQGEKVSESENIEDEIADIPLLSAGGMPIFNLGFGYAF